MSEQEDRPTFFSINIDFGGFSLPKPELRTFAALSVLVSLVLMHLAKDSVWIAGEATDFFGDTVLLDFYLSGGVVEFPNWGFEIEFDYGEGFFPEEVETSLSQFASVNLLLTIAFWLLVIWALLVLSSAASRLPEESALASILEIGVILLPLCSSSFFLAAWHTTGSIESGLVSDELGFPEQEYSRAFAINLTALVGFISGIFWILSDQSIREALNEMRSREFDFSLDTRPFTLGIASTLILASIGGAAAIPMMMDPDSSASTGLNFYDVYVEYWEVGSGSETLTVSSGSTNSVIIDVDASMFGNDSTLYRIEVFGYYSETGLDAFCDTVSIEATSVPLGVDWADQILADEKNDCSDLFIYSYTNTSSSVWGVTGQYALTEEEAMIMKSYFLDVTEGYGEWEIEVEVDPNGSPLDNDEQVTIEWSIDAYTLTFTEILG